MPPKLTIREVRKFERPFKLRLPFRFGAATHTEGRQAVVRARIRLADGREGWGVAAEMLAAKWFDKNPALSDQDNVRQLRRSLEIAEMRYRAAPAQTAFDHFIGGYRQQIEDGRRQELNPLVASYGPALLDRAVLDALCRLFGVSFYAAMQGNLAGMRPHREIADLEDCDFGKLLASLTPGCSIHARHTVGLVDPIDAAPERVNDGLPETLAEVAATYRHRYYKLKVGGAVADDLRRLVEIAAVLDRQPYAYFATLDGNEQYADAAGALELWRAVCGEPKLARLRESILYVEQPIRRARALSAEVGALAAEKPVIVDESDGELASFPKARALGYAGVSSKACKGFYKSVINLARCRMWNAAEGRARYFLSAEDLTTLAGTCVQQDLALVNLLGLGHVERNGHHFVDGFAGRSRGEAEAFASAHPDLYARTPRGPRLRIEDGKIALGSLDCVGFGSAVEPDYAAMEAMPPSGWS